MKLLESKPITLREVAEKLNERKKDANGVELGYEQANTLLYSETFGQLNEPKESSMRKEIAEIAPNLPENAIVAMLNLLPKKEEEVRAIITWSKSDLPEERVKELVKAFKKVKKA